MTERINLKSDVKEDWHSWSIMWARMGPGIRKAIKRAYNKRFRRAAKVSLDNPE